jgi:VanZ family protein
MAPSSSSPATAEFGASSSDTTPATWAARFCRYVLPLFMWMGFIFVMSTHVGAAENSASLVERILGWFRPQALAGMSAERLDDLNYLLRKSAHVVEYAILTLLAVRAFQRDQVGWQRRSAFGGVALSLLYAASDEWHQRFVPDRTATPVDVGVDAVGITIALVCCWAWYRARTDKVTR